MPCTAGGQGRPARGRGTRGCPDRRDPHAPITTTPPPGPATFQPSGTAHLHLRGLANGPRHEPRRLQRCRDGHAGQPRRPRLQHRRKQCRHKHHCRGARASSRDVGQGASFAAAAKSGRQKRHGRAEVARSAGGAQRADRWRRAVVGCAAAENGRHRSQPQPPSHLLCRAALGERRASDSTPAAQGPCQGRRGQCSAASRRCAPARRCLGPHSLCMRLRLHVLSPPTPKLIPPRLAHLDRPPCAVGGIQQLPVLLLKGRLASKGPHRDKTLRARGPSAHRGTGGRSKAAVRSHPRTHAHTRGCCVSQAHDADPVGEGDASHVPGARSPARTQSQKQLPIPSPAQPLADSPTASPESGCRWATSRWNPVA